VAEDMIKQLHDDVYCVHLECEVEQRRMALDFFSRADSQKLSLYLSTV